MFPKSLGKGGGEGCFSAAKESINMFSPRPLSKPAINGGREESERAAVSIPIPVFLNHTRSREPWGHPSIPLTHTYTLYTHTHIFSVCFSLPRYVLFLLFVSVQTQSSIMSTLHSVHSATSYLFQDGRKGGLEVALARKQKKKWGSETCLCCFCSASNCRFYPACCM